MMKQVIKYLGTVLLVLIMLVAVFVLLIPHLGWQIDTVISNSMMPALKAGGLVVTRPVGPTDIKVGDIITYGSPIDEKLVTHRVVAINENNPLLFQTKGDANEDSDPYLVPAQNITGQVCFYIPMLGSVTQFVKSLTGLVLLLLIPGLIIIAIEVWNIWFVIKKEKAKRQYGVG
jgi:signal peptidase